MYGGFCQQETRNPLDPEWCQLDPGGCPLDPVWCQLDPGWCPLDPGWCPLDSRWCPLDSPGWCPLDSSKVVPARWCPLDFGHDLITKTSGHHLAGTAETAILNTAREAVMTASRHWPHDGAQSTKIPRAPPPLDTAPPAHEGARRRPARPPQAPLPLGTAPLGKLPWGGSPE